MATRHFRLLDPQFRETAALYRVRLDRTGLYVERFDPTAGAWTPGPGTFLRFVNEGELGADEISAAEAETLIASGSLPALPVPIGSS